MTVRKLGTLVLALVLAPPVVAASSSTAQGTPPADSPKPDIVVQGYRGDPIVIDFQRIARQCQACKLALAKLQQSATPAIQLRSELTERTKEAQEAIDLHLRRQKDPLAGFTDNCSAACVSTHAQRMMSSQIQGQRRERQKLAQEEAVVMRNAAAYLARLEAYLKPAAEDARRRHRARQIFRPGDPEARYRKYRDVTQEVLLDVDKRLVGVDLTR